MASFRKLTSKTKGTRWLVRVRLKTKTATETFGSRRLRPRHGRGCRRARSKPASSSRRPSAARCCIADAVDSLRAERARLRLPPGSTFDNALERLKRDARPRSRGGIRLAEVSRRIASPAGAERLDRRRRPGLRDQRVEPRRRERPQHRRRRRRDGHARRCARPACRSTSRERRRRVSDAEITALLAVDRRQRGTAHLPSCAIWSNSRSQPGCVAAKS